MKRKKNQKYHALLWSIALPGFGQFVNKKVIKGITLMIAEFVVNMQSSFNTAIMLSFNGKIQEAIEVTDFQWLMFYPCLYMFGLWDAFRDNNEGNLGPYAYLPLACSAYSVTVGLMYSTRVQIFGYMPGPVFLPMLALIPGLIIGNLFRIVLEKRLERKEEAE